MLDYRFIKENLEAVKKNIIDRNMRLVYTVTETQLIEGIAVYGMNTPMRKFVGI